jgi:hypothetical protein
VLRAYALFVSLLAKTTLRSPKALGLGVNGGDSDRLVELLSSLYLARAECAAAEIGGETRFVVPSTYIYIYIYIIGIYK